MKKKGEKVHREPAAPPADRARRSWNGIKAAFGVALVLGTAGATAYGGYQLALSSTSFAIRDVQVETSRRMPDREVARRAGIQFGESLLALDLDEAERRLLEDPWVRSVRVTRQLPHTVRVQLHEHEAVALSALDGRVFLVDSSGEPFKVWEGGDEHDLPVITGLTAEDLAKDRAGSIARLGVGLTVLEQYQRLPVSRKHRAQEVHLAADGSVTLTVGMRGVALHLGQGPWPKKLLMVAEVLRKFEKERELPGVVFLDNALHPERVVVRMR